MCADAFHLVKLVSEALDEVRRELWTNCAASPATAGPATSRGHGGHCSKNPEDLTDALAAQLGRIRRSRGRIWRAYDDEGAVPGHPGRRPSREEAAYLLDRWCARASRSRMAPFVKVAKTMRQRRDMILNAIEHGISNAGSRG